MRANGVHALAAYCSARGCHHAGVVDIEQFGDDVAVPSFGPRLRCARFGQLGAEPRPDWQRAPITLFGSRC